MPLLHKLSQLPEGESGIIKNLTSSDFVNERLKAFGFEKKLLLKCYEGLNIMAQFISKLALLNLWLERILRMKFI